MKNSGSSLASMDGNKEIQWILDSGASHHMTPFSSILEGIPSLEKPFYITVPMGNTVLVERVGNLKLDRNIKLPNVLIVPDYS